MKSIHFTLDFHQLFEFTGRSHLLVFLRNPRHSPLRVVYFIYIEKKKKPTHNKHQLVLELTFTKMTPDYQHTSLTEHILIKILQVKNSTCQISAFITE